MTATICAVCCSRPTPDGLVCSTCASRVGGQLAAIVQLAPDARLVAAGLVRRGSGGGGSNKPGSRPPLDVHATDALHAVTNALTTIVREIADTRGLQTPRDGHTLSDPLAVVCRWLSGQVEWLRHASDDQGGAYAVGVFDEIGQCLRRIRGIVDGPSEKKYLGPCGALRVHGGFCVGSVCFEDDFTDECDCWCHKGDPETCEGDVYGVPGAQTGACRTCGAQVDQAERQAWNDAEVRASSFRASEIEDAYGVSANLIRQWATEARALLRVHDRDMLGRARYMLGEVLDVAAGQAVKRAEAQAKRARRAAEAAEVVA